MRPLRVVLWAAAIAAVAIARCPSEDWKPLFGKCYWASPPDVLLQNASVAAACDSLYPGARMVSIHELTVHAFITEKLLNFTQAWIGLNCHEQQWYDGTPKDFGAWLSHEGFMENCTITLGGQGTGGWQFPGAWTCTGTSCEQFNRFLCETDEE